MTLQKTMFKPLTKEAIAPQYADDLTVQDYSKKPVIDGVQIIPLNMFMDDGGSLAEILRFDDEGNCQILPEFKIKQATFSQMMPGTIKAFHMHYNQEDIWFVMPYDRLLIGLVDCRQNSKTFNLSMRFVMGGGRAQALYIPRGVAHGRLAVRESMAAAGRSPAASGPRTAQPAWSPPAAPGQCRRPP